jgi:hypothetical protein
MGRTACTEPQCLYSRAIPLLPLWAVQPVQSLSACTMVHFTVYIHPYKVKFFLHLSTALCTRARFLAVTLDPFLLISVDGSQWSSPSSVRFIPGERAFGIRWTGEGWPQTWFDGDKVE